MKNVLSFCLFFGSVILSPPALHADAAPAVQLVESKEEYPLGSEVIREIREAYEKGAFTAYLHTLQDEYLKADKEGMFNKVLQNQRKTRKERHDALKKIADSVSSLEKERNRQLQELYAQNPDLVLSRKVKAISSFSLSKEQEEAFNYLYELQTKFSGEGKNPSEEKLIEIDREYQLKSLLVTFAQLKTNKDYQTQRAQKIIVHLDKLEKMAAAAKGFEDKNTAKHIATAKSLFFDYRAYKVDLDDLELLARGKINPSNPLEEKIKTAMAGFIEKRESLYIHGPTDSSSIAQP